MMRPHYLMSAGGGFNILPRGHEFRGWASGGADYIFIHRFAFISNRGKVPVGTVFTGTRKANASSNDFSSRFTKAYESRQPGAGSFCALNSVSERAVLTVTWYSAASPQARMMS